jgi:teichuronic acid biosynthesis glycosyltransferase TuaH
MKKAFDIVMFSMSNYAEWERGVSNRNYHVLKELSQSDRVNKILTVDYPPLTLKRAFRNQKEGIFTSLREGTVVSRSFYDKLTKMSENLYVYSNSEFFLRPEQFIEHVKKIALKLNFGDFVLWSYFPPVMEYTRSMGQKITVFDAVDNWIEHSSYASMKDRMRRNYKIVTQTADVIFTVASELQKVFDNQPNVYWIPNGVDLTHYQTKHILINRDIADIPRPIIGYIGVIQERVDLDLIKYLAKKNPTKSFVLVGPVWRDTDKQELRDIPNIYMLGYKSYKEAPSYIQQFDIALIPHRKSEFVTSTNPMKMYEYLACGKPVIATKHAGADMLKKFVYIAKDNADFDQKIDRALEEDSEEKRKKRKEVVADFSWDRTVKQMLDLIEKKFTY